MEITPLELLSLFSDFPQQHDVLIFIYDRKYLLLLQPPVLLRWASQGPHTHPILGTALRLRDTSCSDRNQTIRPV